MSLYDVTIPMFGPARWLIASLSSPAAAKPWAKLPQLRRGRLIPRSFCSAMRSRYGRRVGFDRSMMRSVTAPTVELIVIWALLFVPADAVTLRERDCRRWAPCSGRVGPRRHAFFRPAG